MTGLSGKLDGSTSPKSFSRERNVDSHSSNIIGLSGKLDGAKSKRSSGESGHERNVDEDPEKSLSQADYDYNVSPPSGPQHQYGVGGVGLTQRRLSARHVTFIGFGGGIGTGLFVGTGSALAKAGPAGLLIAYIVVGAILWCIMECLGEMATYVSQMSFSWPG